MHKNKKVCEVCGVSIDLDNNVVEVSKVCWDSTTQSYTSKVYIEVWNQSTQKNDVVAINPMTITDYSKKVCSLVRGDRKKNCYLACTNAECSWPSARELDNKSETLLRDIGVSEADIEYLKLQYNERHH